VTGQPGDVCRIWKLSKDAKPKELQALTPPGMYLSLRLGDAWHRRQGFEHLIPGAKLHETGGDKTLCFRDCKFSSDGKHLYTIQTKSRSDSYLTRWSTQSWKV
jgi:hypothetical protein